MKAGLALVNTETGEIVEQTRRLPEDATAQKLEELSEDNAGLRKANRSLNAEIRNLKREINELLVDAAPDAEWDEFAAWWVSYTKRSTARTKVDSGTDRWKAYARLRKRWERREIALMVVGAHHHHFAPFHKRDDMENFAKSVSWAETCLEIGLQLHPEKETET